MSHRPTLREVERVRQRGDNLRDAESSGRQRTPLHQTRAGSTQEQTRVRLGCRWTLINTHASDIDRNSEILKRKFSRCVGPAKEGPVDTLPANRVEELLPGGVLQHVLEFAALFFGKNLLHAGFGIAQNAAIILPKIVQNRLHLFGLRRMSD